MIQSYLVLCSDLPSGKSMAFGSCAQCFVVYPITVMYDVTVIDK